MNASPAAAVLLRCLRSHSRIRAASAGGRSCSRTRPAPPAIVRAVSSLGSAVRRATRHASTCGRPKIAASAGSSTRIVDAPRQPVAVNAAVLPGWPSAASRSGAPSCRSAPRARGSARGGALRPAGSSPGAVSTSGALTATSAVEPTIVIAVDAPGGRPMWPYSSADQVQAHHGAAPLVEISCPRRAAAIASASPSRSRRLRAGSRGLARSRGSDARPIGPPLGSLAGQARRTHRLGPLPMCW